LKLSLLDAIANLAVAKMPFEAKLRILKEADKCPTLKEEIEYILRRLEAKEKVKAVE